MKRKDCNADTTAVACEFFPAAVRQKDENKNAVTTVVCVVFLVCFRFFPPVRIKVVTELVLGF